MFLALCYCCHDVTLVDAKTRFARCLGGRWGLKSDSYFLVHMPRGKKLLANRMPPRSPSLCAFEEMQTPFGCVLRSVCRVCVAHQGPRLGPIFLARAARFHRPESGRDPCGRACKTVCYGLSSRNFFDFVGFGLNKSQRNIPITITPPLPSLTSWALARSQCCLPHRRTHFGLEPESFLAQIQTNWGLRISPHFPPLFEHGQFKFV